MVLVGGLEERTAKATVFSSALFRRGTPIFCVFDLLYLDGEDVRERPLIERKRMLRRIVPEGCPFLLYVDHVEGEGERLFQLACERDLEGIVAKAGTSSSTAIRHG